ncbi:uncharacterized protein LOC100183512 isoform X2 [Ciona intestinalis]
MCLQVISVLVILLLMYARRANAYEYCGDGYYCRDSGSKIQYCCGKNSTGTPFCCSYTAFWGMWYFWMGMSLVFVILIVVLKECYKMVKKVCNQSPVQLQTETVTTERHNAQDNPAFQKPMSDSPPSYQDLQHLYGDILYPQPNYEDDTLGPPPAYPGLQTQDTPCPIEAPITVTISQLTIETENNQNSITENVTNLNRTSST